MKPRAIGAVAAVAGIVYTVLGLALVEEPRVHMALLGLGAAYVFAAGVAIVYAASFRGAGPREELLLIHVASTVVLPLVAGYFWDYVAPVLLVSAVSGLYAIYVYVRSVGGDARVPALLLCYPYLAVVPLALLLQAGRVWLLDFYLLLAYLFPVPMIYAVSLHSFPKTYGYRFSWPWTAATLLTHVAGATLSLAGLQAGFVLMAASMVPYLLAIGIHRVPEALGFASKLGSAARKAHTYLVTGYLFAAAAAIYVLYLQVMAYLGDAPLLQVIHAVLMGFVGMHIYTHAPLMLPVMLATPTARRYTPTPYMLLLASTLARYPYPDLSYGLMVASLVALVLVVKPARRKIISPLTKETNTSRRSSAR